MAERTKPVKLTEEELRESGNYSPVHIARIINASLFREAGNAAAVSTLIDGIHKNEEFILLLMKVINPRNTAFFQNIIGICETRLKESAEKENALREGNQQ